ncbi:UNKNOWN [Stylonychia lemnae]|uniref:Uncharacterized protein n=1 Tax=Stylonychia lemnae TaxID=5949 RepID=A0A078AGV4_STYLE|nr:UNKNOWN [Stylonychia lemnae]|eukprot:CDW80757.1 UNKNOWN [Stylonychia lemnae]
MVECLGDCAKYAFPMFLGGTDDVTKILGMDINDLTQEIVISGVNHDSKVALGSGSSGYPFIAYLEQGNVYRWAKVVLRQYDQYIQVRFGYEKEQVLAMSDKEPHTIIILNVNDGSLK